MKRGAYFITALLVSALRAEVAPFHLPASAQNYLVKFTALGAHLEGSYGDFTAGDGQRILVLAATWENKVDVALADKRNLPYRVANDDFRESVQLVIDGRELVPALVLDTNTAYLDTEDHDLLGQASAGGSYIRKTSGIKNAAGKRAQAYLALEKPGDRTTGDLLFALPARDWQSLELLYRDPLGDNFRVLLAGAVPVVPEPANVQNNEVLALAARLVEDQAPAATAPPRGRRYVTVDFHGKSLLKVQDAYPPYDPGHEPEALRWRPDPARWIEFRGAVEIIADGTLPCGLDPLSDVPDIALFTPETWTKHRLVFLVPAKAKTLDLVCRFATYQIPGIDHDVAPKPMRFHLAGPVATAPTPSTKPEVKLVDGGLELLVVHHGTQASVAEVAAEPGEKFLVVDFVLHNAGTEVEAFKAGEQLTWFGPDGAVPPDEVSALNPLTAPQSFGLAPGESRSFQVIWRIPAKVTAVELGLRGNFAAEKFKLSLPIP